MPRKLSHLAVAVRRIIEKLHHDSVQQDTSYTDESTERTHQDAHIQKEHIAMHGIAKPQTSVVEKPPVTASKTGVSEPRITERIDTRGMSKDDTLIRKPSTYEIREQLNIRRTSRWGELLPANRAILMLVFPDTKKPPIRIEIKDKLVIGRLQSHNGPAPDLHLNRYGAYIRGVSRQHIALIKHNDFLQVMDLGSTNGTYLNGARLKAYQTRILRDGDQLHLGQLSVGVLFVSPDDTPDIQNGDDNPGDESRTSQDK